MTAEAHIYIVDDDSAVRESLRWLLESAGHAVEAFDSARDFLRNYSDDSPGCLLLDVRMPGMSGLELQETLKDRGVDTPIIIITGHGDVPMAVQAMKAGAVEFIEKPFNDQVLLDRIQQCVELDRRRRQDTAARSDITDRSARLTPREREVLDAVVAGKPNKIIADELNISIKTVEIHRARGMTKMEAGSLAELVTLWIQGGLKSEEPPVAPGRD